MKSSKINRLLWLASVASEIAILLAFLVLVSMLWGKLPLPHHMETDCILVFFLGAEALLLSVCLAFVVRKERRRGYWGLARCVFYFFAFAIVYPAFTCA